MPQSEALTTLLAACYRREVSAQERLYHQWYAFARAKAYPYGRNLSEVEEIVQDAFLKLFTALAKEVFMGSFSPWFRRIIVNAGIDHYRRYQVNQQRVAAKWVRQDSVANEAEQSLEQEDCLRFLQRLSPAYRLVFTLHVFEGYRHPEIAARLGISEGTSRSNLFKARELLRPLVAAYLHSNIDSSNG